MTTGDDDIVNARDLIVNLRGGVPTHCAFCNQETPPDDLHPEEGSLWACITCINRWEKEDQ